MKVKAIAKSMRLIKPFGISRGTKTSAEVIQTSITRDGVTGFGEAVPYFRYGETTDTSLAQISSLPAEFDRQDLLGLLPQGASRNALDAALWDLESKEAGVPVWELAGFQRPVPRAMSYTVSLRGIGEMTSDAKEHANIPLIKVKLGGPDDAKVVAEIRQVAPNARLIVDVNEGWDISQFEKIIPVLVAAQVELVEQPLPSNQDDQLAKLACPIPLCADESYAPGSSIADLSEAYSFLNIKLDKSGGLTRSIQVFNQAIMLDMGVMVGCMISSSLSIAPAFLLAQRANYSDLDGFLSIANDHENPMRVQDGFLTSPEELWGYPASS